MSRRPILCLNNKYYRKFEISIPRNNRIWPDPEAAKYKISYQSASTEKLVNIYVKGDEYLVSKGNIRTAPTKSGRLLITVKNATGPLEEREAKDE